MAFLAAIPAVLGSIGAATAGAASVASTVGTVLSVGGSILGGISAMQQGNYQASVARQNASIAEENARRAVDRAQIQQQDTDRETAALIGTQESLQGASGLLVTGRSQMLTRKAAAEIGRQDALNVRQAGEVEAYGYKNEAASQIASASMARATGRMGLLSGFINAGTSLVNANNRVKNPERYTAGARA